MILLNKVARVILTTVLASLSAHTYVLANPSLQNGIFSSPLSVGWTGCQMVSVDTDVTVFPGVQDCYLSEFL